MKKLLALLVFCSLFLSFTTSPIKAAYNFDKDSGIKEMGDKTGFDTGSTLQPESYIGNLLTILFSFVGLIFLILTIYAGIAWMTAQGDSAQVTKAKETLIRATVGLIITMAAYGITYFVVNLFQQTKGSEFIDSPIDNGNNNYNNPVT